ncbi:hypothetical protein LguiB_032517 [Lonicera macranthoides]
MADNSFFLLLFLLTAFYTASAERTFTNIATGSSLTPTGNSFWQSLSGLYAFGFYPQGSGYSVGIFISGIPEKTVVWTANRDNPPVNQSTTLVLNANGRLVLRTPQGEETLVATNSQPASSASMLDTGNFVLYNSNRDIIWQSFENPTDTLLVDQSLLNGRGLTSSISETDHSTGISYLAMQTDGHLVQFPFEGPHTTETSYYASDTAGAGSNTTLNLDDDGHLYLFNSSIIKNLTNGGYPKERRIYLVRNDVDGIFRLYSYNLDQQDNWLRLWSSSADNCVAKGVCGRNGFCVLDDTEAKCLCIPGFDFVDSNRWNAGCVRNSAVRSCKDGSIEYSMRELVNTVWEDTSYSTLTDTTKEDCKSACLKDCNCEAALFKDGQCTMQRLPLQFGRRSLHDSNIALVKVESTPIMDRDPPDHLPKKIKKERKVQILVISVSVVVFAFIVYAISGILVYRNRVWAYKIISEKGNGELSGDLGPKAFTYAELDAVTNGFRDEVGSGSFGTVYKAILEEWVYQCLEDGKLGKLVGEEAVDKRKLDKMVKVGLWCIQDEPSIRPSMKKVLLMLEGTVEIPIPPSPTCFLSAI